MVPLALILLLTAGQDAPAADQPGPHTLPPATVQAGAELDDDDRVVCKTRLKRGSRFRERVCRTNREWETRTEAAIQAFREVQHRPQTPMGE